MRWNYRVMKLTDEAGEEHFDLMEVYYNDDGSLMGYCNSHPFNFYDDGDITKAIEFYKKTLYNIEIALDKPVLTPLDFDKPKE